VLGRCQSDLLLVAACDMPFLKAELYQYLLEQLALEKKACIGAVPVVAGKIHPLAAVYRKEWQNTLKTQLAIGNYRLLDALEKEAILYVDVTKKEGFQKMLSNINTLKEYENL
jgi:molybdopterin-guanine dinucleotide biosynthesis protein A